MKKLDIKEFQDRIEAAARARKIFTPHLTKSISVAFELYQEILAEQDRLDRLNSRMARRIPTIFDKYERPKCPKCGADLKLRTIMRRGKCPRTGERIPRESNKFGWRTCWECRKGDCTYEEYSRREWKDWLITLTPKKEEE